MPISGKEMVRLYQRAGWVKVRQKGSHVRMKKNGKFETIPLHKELKKGTEADLLKRLMEED